MNARLHIFVSGNVQGIGFRSWTRWLARKMNLHGWVKNTDDEVEILVEGPEKIVKDFVKALWKGPIGSRVESVSSTTEMHKGEFSDFIVKR
jgi:acylphosphatase